MKQIIYILSLLVTSLLLSCLGEDDVFEEPFIDESNAVETSLITSFLNEEFIKNSVNTSNCFSFIFPIEVAYNTEQLITIANFNGLETAAKSQSSNFYINSLVYPLTVSIGNEEVAITNSNEFNALFTNCNIPTLKYTLLENVGNCIDYKYPINVIDTSKNEVTINSTADNIDFLENENSEYIPTIIFPITLNDSTIINSYFDLYDVTNKCKADVCPDITFTKNIISNDLLTYKFSASGAPENRYNWYINNEYILTVLAGNYDEFLTHEFTENGVYKICVFVETPECPSGIEYCEEVIINEIDECIELEIQKNLISNDGKEYLLKAITNSDLTNFSWYAVDGDAIMIIDESGNNSEISYQFSNSGTYEICALLLDSDCESPIKKCIELEVVVENDTQNVFDITVSNPIATGNCFDLLYDYTISQNNTNKFILEANQIDNLTDNFYNWSIKKSSENNEVSIGTGRIVEYEFTEVEDYTIQVLIETPECPNGVTYSKDFNVELITTN